MIFGHHGPHARILRPARQFERIEKPLMIGVGRRMHVEVDRPLHEPFYRMAVSHRFSPFCRLAVEPSLRSCLAVGSNTTIVLSAIIASFGPAYRRH